MGNPFQSLLTAMVDDDRAKVKELLKKDAGLVAGVAETKSQCLAGLAHWIYAGDTALHVAAAGHRVEIARMLLDAGADPCSSKNRRRSQPLHYAADGYLENPSWNEKQQIATIRLLLRAGARIDAQDQNGATPLHRAVRTRCAAAVECLLEAGSPPSLGNKSGSTPFHLAVQDTGRGGSGAQKARAAQKQIIEAFLQRGVSPSLRDGKGKSVVECARSEWIRQILLGRDGQT
jgi:hypothetical protein